MASTVVASVHAAPVLDLAEHVLDLLAFAVEHALMKYLNFPVGLRWDAI